jgi:hypothetical protein
MSFGTSRCGQEADSARRDARLHGRLEARRYRAKAPPVGAWFGVLAACHRRQPPPSASARKGLSDLEADKAADDELVFQLCGHGGHMLLDGHLGVLLHEPLLEQAGGLVKLVQLA